MKLQTINNQSIDEILSILEIKKSDLKHYSEKFVPYLILDGHRTSCISNNEVENYKNGIHFFLRFTKIMKSLNFCNLATLVHSNRNIKVQGRIQAVEEAAKDCINSNLNFINSLNFKFYGDIEGYKDLGFNDFYELIERISTNLVKTSNFTNHILVNYSEDWAVKNLEKFNGLPEISTVIRFTKGHISGLWIPLRMQNSSFIYCQVPSVSDFWSDNGILALLLISFKNWLDTKNFIGHKVYNENERHDIHLNRDVNLNMSKVNLRINSPCRIRIITFNPQGPIIYEIN
jgi:hypothetical protein